MSERLRLDGVSAPRTNTVAVRSRNHREIATHARKIIPTPVQTSPTPVWVTTRHELAPDSVSKRPRARPPREGRVTGWSLDPQLRHGAPQLAYFTPHFWWNLSTGVMGTSPYRHTWDNRTVAALTPPAVSTTRSGVSRVICSIGCIRLSPGQEISCAGRVGFKRSD